MERESLARSPLLLGQDRLAELLAVATEHSGRRGIAADVAPSRVLAILGLGELPPT